MAGYHELGADRGYLPDGRRLWVFTQSGISDISICPERARLGAFTPGSSPNTDTLALGTAVHAAIEQTLRADIEAGVLWEMDEAIDYAVANFHEQMGDPNAKWVKRTADEAELVINRCVSTWWDEVYPTLSPLAVEHHFDLTLYEDDERVIRLEGTIDLIDSRFGLCDWKTASRKHIEWEKKRWDVQPTAYTWAWSMETVGVPSDGYEPWYTMPFTWYVMVANGDLQTYECRRGPEDWAWLKQRALDTAVLLEANLPVWPRNDHTALCSPKFCDAWDQCKGRFFA